MRAVSTMIVAAVLATAAIASSAIAASLDVEPVKTPSPSPVVQDADTNNNSASNATSDGKIDIQQECRAMKYVNWDNVKHACHWDHTVFIIDARYNHFFKYFDGSVVMECDCDSGLSYYDPWGSRWTPSSHKHVMCYTRDGRLAYDVKSEFDAYKC